MKSTLARGLMVPIEEYASVAPGANLYEAVVALERAQEAFDPSRHKHRAVLVLDENKNVVGKITMFDVLISLEPKYEKLDDIGMLSHSGISPDFLKSMLQDNVLWDEPLEFICGRATQLKASDVMEVLSEGAYIDENATLGESIHQLVMQNHHSLLVTRSEKVVGVLRLSDVFGKICEEIKSCKI